MDDNKSNCEMIEREKQLHLEAGYKGDVVDKMYKSVRYYYRKKKVETTTEKKEQQRQAVFQGTRREAHIANAEVLQHELKMWDTLTANRDQRIWARANSSKPELDGKGSQSKFLS